MKFGCCTNMDYYDAVDELGYDFIELAGSQVMKMPEGQLTEIAEKLKNGRVKCNGFNIALPPEIKVVGPEYSAEKARAYAKELCRRGGLLGIRAIGIGSPNSRKLPEGYDLEAAQEQAEEFVRIFAQEAAPYDIMILWEALNHLECNFGLFFTEGAEMVRRLDIPNLGMVCDLYHMALQDEGPQALAGAIPLVRHVHVAQRVGTERQYPKMANIDDYQKMITPLIKGGYDGIIATEAFDGPVVEGAKEAIGVFRELVKRAQAQ